MPTCARSPYLSPLQLTLTSLADLSKEEMAAEKQGLDTSAFNDAPDEVAPAPVDPTNPEPIPDKVNWVAARKVTPIRDQGKVRWIWICMLSGWHVETARFRFMFRPSGDPWTCGRLPYQCSSFSLRCPTVCCLLGFRRRWGH